MHTSKTIQSPSGKYTLKVLTKRLPSTVYPKNLGVDTVVSEGIVTNANGTLISKIERNFSSFDHSFVLKDDQEYLITGRHYLGQTVINLDTGEEYNDPTYESGANYRSTEFIWIKCWLDPTGTTLIVNGCHWGGPSLYKFYDFSNPSEGWPQLEAPYLYEGDPDQNGPHFYEDGSFSLLIEDDEGIPEKVVVLKRENNTLIEMS